MKYYHVFHIYVFNNEPSTECDARGVTTGWGFAVQLLPSDRNYTIRTDTRSPVPRGVRKKLASPVREYEISDRTRPVEMNEAIN